MVARSKVNGRPVEWNGKDWMYSDNGKGEICTAEIVHIDEKLRERIMGAVARGWCTAENENKEMDSTLAIAISFEVLKELGSICTTCKYKKLDEFAEKIMGFMKEEVPVKKVEVVDERGLPNE